MHETFVWNAKIEFVRTLFILFSGLRRHTELSFMWNKSTRLLEISLECYARNLCLKCKNRIHSNLIRMIWWLENTHRNDFQVKQRHNCPYMITSKFMHRIWVWCVKIEFIWTSFKWFRVLKRHIQMSLRWKTGTHVLQRPLVCYARNSCSRWKDRILSNRFQMI